MEKFDPNKPMEGFGDLIALLTHALGVDTLAQNAAQLLGQEDCGCNKRREQLNELLPFNKNKKEDDATERIEDEQTL